jgi:predicted transcriptional regulator
MNAEKPMFNGYETRVYAGEEVFKIVKKALASSEKKIKELEAELQENQQISDRISTLIMERDNARKALSELQDEVNKKIKERQDVAESTCIYVVFREALEIFNQAIDSRKVKG